MPDELLIGIRFVGKKPYRYDLVPSRRRDTVVSVPADCRVKIAAGLVLVDCR